MSQSFLADISRDEVGKEEEEKSCGLGTGTKYPAGTVLTFREETGQGQSLEWEGVRPRWNFQLSIVSSRKK